MSEFRSKFEKFGSSRSKSKSDSEQQGVRKTELDAQEVSKDLQRQLVEQERSHAEERRQLLDRLETLRAGLEKDNRELRERNSEVRL